MCIPTLTSNVHKVKVVIANRDSFSYFNDNECIFVKMHLLYLNWNYYKCKEIEHIDIQIDVGSQSFLANYTCSSSQITQQYTFWIKFSVCIHRICVYLQFFSFFVLWIFKIRDHIEKFRFFLFFTKTHNLVNIQTYNLPVRIS